MTYRRSVILLIIALLSSTSLVAQPQRGRASYYSKRATGDRTANGDRLHHDSLTCAHRTYPFGTLLKVTNLSNNKEVIVKVNDRGPFGHGRIIDLSWSAAKELGMLDQGITAVEITPYADSKGVPYRQDDILNLPEIDFHIADAGYSFIDKWTADSGDDNEMPSQIKKVTPSDSKPSTSATPTNTSPGKVRIKAYPEKQTKKTNKWSNVFEKLKNWGKDVF